MFETVLFSLWFFLPAGIANSAPVFASKIPMLNKFTTPIDFGKNFRGKRIFGDHKTIRGFLSGIFLATITVGIQMFIYINSEWVQSISSQIDYSNPIVLIMGASMGFGALLGDAIKSFFKRQMSVPSGESWFPFDQIDYIVGGLIASLPFTQLGLFNYLIIAVVWFVIHPIATFIGWTLKLKDKPI